MRLPSNIERTKLYHEYHYQPKQYNDPSEPSAKSEYFLLKAGGVHGENVNGDNFDLT